jgi:long-chain acyl-CoA synthetase
MLLGMSTNERFFCVLPLFHVFAQNTCLWLPVMIGSSVIIVQRIDRSLIMSGLRKKPTIFFGMPALYGLLCLMKTAPLDSIKIFVSGADMLPAKISSLFSIVYGRKICPGYGLSEAAPVVAVNHENQCASTIEVGYPVAAMECQIRDDEGRPLGAHTIGTLWLKGDNVMMGYYKAPHLTDQVVQDGWLNTGDVASIDNEGRLSIHGRTKDVIIHKGFNIYPAEVENVLLMHPAIIKAAVIGFEEQTTGQVPVAFVACKSPKPALEHELRALCKHNLAPYKIPRTFVCLEDLPINATGKVDKKQLRARHMQSNTN